jgi:Dolichyl-phosphate-mannose-protein mannosyltransferase
MAAFDRSAWRATERPPVAWTLLIVLALSKLGIHLLSSLVTYGYMTDELYYLDCANHLAWGYVDHPPLSVAALALLRLTLGDSLMALRLVPALAGAATVVLVGLMARELGGGRTAQGLAALAAVVAPVYLGVDAFYSMNAFEPAFWALAAYLLLRLENGAPPRLWLLVGVVIGLGLLNKISMLWLALGLGVGLLLTPQRRWLLTPWPWLAGAIGLLLFAPYIVWQVANGWPTLEFMHNAMQFKMQAKSPLRFLAEQVLIMHPLLVPFWLSGLAYYFIDASGRRFRLLAWIWATVLLLLMVSGSTRSNYMGPAYVLLLPAGGVAVEQLARWRSWPWLPPALAGAVAVGGVAVAPLAVDLLPPAQYITYAHAIGLRAPADQVDAIGVMPLHFALKFHAPAIIAAVREAYAALPEEDRARAGILASSFGEAGAINFFGPDAGLPHAVSGHNNYFLWGPGGYNGDVMLVFAEPDAAVLKLFEHVALASKIQCPYCLPGLTATAIYICRGSHRPLPELWEQLKNYV